MEMNHTGHWSQGWCVKNTRSPTAAAAAAAAAKLLQSCLTLCDHIDGSPPGSPIHGLLQASTLRGHDLEAIPVRSRVRQVCSDSSEERKLFPSVL